MGMHIDEARSYYVTSSVDHFFGAGMLQVTDGVNAIVRDRDIPGERLGTGAVDDAPSSDQQVTSIRQTVDAHRGRALALFCLSGWSGVCILAIVKLLVMKIKHVCNVMSEDEFDSP